jgi:gamma-glutamylcyclotransferase (GGCT)/AIG2-like uncharacterized protein YtfP
MYCNVFAYGTLMLPEIVEALTGTVVSSRPARLYGYSRYTFKNRCYPGIIADTNGLVDGVIYNRIDNRTLSVFDWFEDVLYERRVITVHAGDGMLDAYAYIVSAKHHNKLGDSPWDLEQFVEKHASRYALKCIKYRKMWEIETGCNQGGI